MGHQESDDKELAAMVAMVQDYAQSGQILS